MTTLNDKERAVLAAVDEAGPITVDEFVSPRGLYINSWAPTFTKLRQAGLLKRTGEKRTTSHGKEAFVLRMTLDGHKALIS